MKPIIRVSNLGKQYRIGRREDPYGSLRQSLVRATRTSVDRLRCIFDRRREGHGTTSEDLFWALREVDFEVQPCEVVGVIGRNGAGKSTLLKILSRVTEPTTGRVDLYGRVGSLLEVGTGFHPELTGRENIYLNGAILGMGRREIMCKLDEIIAFAEIEKFADTPVKRYSNGMYMRLAFAVAAHLEPEILIIDEVLAVGDAQFQKKCLGKISEVARHGRTVLFVSHNLVAVQALCTRCVWLDQGHLLSKGPTTDVIRDYLKAGSTSITRRVWDSPESAPGNDRIRMRSVRLVLPAGVTDDTITITTPFEVEFEYQNLKENCRLNLFMLVHNEDNVCVFNTTSYGGRFSAFSGTVPGKSGPNGAVELNDNYRQQIVDARPTRAYKERRWDGLAFPKGVFRSTCGIPADLLNDGVYRISVVFVEDTTVAISIQNDLLKFEIHDDRSERGQWYGKWYGVTRPRLQWDTTCLQGISSSNERL